MSSMPQKYRIVWANGDVEDLPLCYLRVDHNGKFLWVENRTSYSVDIVRTINLEQVRSWEPIL